MVKPDRGAYFRLPAVCPEIPRDDRDAELGSHHRRAELMPVDEPTSARDPERAGAILDRPRRVAVQRRTMLFEQVPPQAPGESPQDERLRACLRRAS